MAYEAIANWHFAIQPPRRPGSTWRWVLVSGCWQANTLEQS
ncbi:hypothetical protein RISK_001070 [Rhodopirellula islandica]|uniref:Uncharacterized protein n=1 Tax=Rhodopirellula islandica TaxID=595434 RepID=A0A0J1BK66_RHOIS|nr:hypothetical protein RISK_001070 [Rhodopirellula islandica]